MKHRTLPWIMAVCASLLVAAPTLAGDKVTLKDVPEAVRDTIVKHVGKGKLHDIERETEKGVVSYEAEYVAEDGSRFEIDVAEDGKLLSKKRE